MTTRRKKIPSRRGYVMDCTPQAKQVWEYLWPTTPFPETLEVFWHKTRAHQWGDFWGEWLSGNCVIAKEIRLNWNAFSAPERIAEIYHVPSMSHHGVIQTLVHEFIHARGYGRHTAIFDLAVRAHCAKLGVEAV